MTAQWSGSITRRDSEMMWLNCKEIKDKLFLLFSFCKWNHLSPDCTIQPGTCKFSIKYAFNTASTLSNATQKPDRCSFYSPVPTTMSHTWPYRLFVSILTPVKIWQGSGSTFICLIFPSRNTCPSWSLLSFVCLYFFHYALFINPTTRANPQKRWISARGSNMFRCCIYTNLNTALIPSWHYCHLHVTNHIKLFPLFSSSHKDPTVFLSEPLGCQEWPHRPQTQIHLCPRALGSREGKMVVWAENKNGKGKVRLSISGGVVVTGWHSLIYLQSL